MKAIYLRKLVSFNPIADRAFVFNQKTESYLRNLTENPNIRYIQDTPDFDRISYVARLQSIGFSIEGADLHNPIYKGKDPSGALDKLLKLPLLILDCKSALNLARLLAFRDTIGADKFNQSKWFASYQNFEGFKVPSFLTEHTTQVSKINLRDSPPLADMTMYHQTFDSISTVTPDKVDLQPGDQVFIMGTPYAFAFRPTVETNAFNVLYVGKDSEGEHQFFGFRSDIREGFTYSQLMDLFQETLEAPLTVGDLRRIYSNMNGDPNGYAPYSPLTNKEIWEALCPTPQDKEAAKDSCKDHNNLMSGSTRFVVPEQFKTSPALGVREVHRTNQTYFNQGVRPEVNWVSIDMMRPLIPTEDFFSNFDSEAFHQQDMMEVLYTFHQNCLDSSKQKTYGGLFLWGDPGTGKTELCKQVVGKLERAGKSVYKQTMHNASDGLPDFINLLSKCSTDEKGLLDAIIQRFKERWSKMDVFYLDDINTPISEHAYIAKAIIKFAQQEHKQVLVNSNIQVDFLLGSNDPIVGFFAKHHVVGEDYRMRTAWFNHPAPTPIAMPSGKIWTDEQHGIFNLTHSLLQACPPDDHNIGIFVTGAPGIGKTTAIKEALSGTSYLTIAPSAPPTLEEIRASDATVILFDDINGLRSNFKYSQLVSELLNSDACITNRVVQPIKFIITSNEKADRLFKADITKPSFQNTDIRRESRFRRAFAVFDCELTKDFRSSQADARFSVGSDRVVQEGVFTLVISEYCNTCANFAESDDWYAQNSYREAILTKIQSASSLSVVYEDRLSFGADTLWKTILDNIENGTLGFLHIQAVDPQECLDRLKAFFAGSGQKQYVSRLNRISVTTPTPS